MSSVEAMNGWGKMGVVDDVWVGVVVVRLLKERWLLFLFD
jgi:hypothetical protein